MADPDLAACYDFDNRLLDVTGAGNDPVLATGYAFTAGVHDAALATSVATIVHIEPTANLATSQLSIAAWIRPDELPTPGGRALVFDHQELYALGLEPSGVVRCYVQLGQTLDSDVMVVPGEWSHVACVVTESTMVVLVDGVERARRAIVPPQAVVSSVAIAGNVPAGDPFIGAIDALHIWRRAILPPTD